MGTAPIPAVTATPPVKAGYKTSEFWVSLAAMGSILASQFTGHEPNALVEGSTVAVAAVYNLVRMFVKVKR